MRRFVILLTVLLATSPAPAQHQESGPVHVMSAWSRALPPVSRNGAVYLSMKNYAAVPDRLVGASSPIAEQVEIHTHAMEGGMVTMRRLVDIVLNPGEYVRLEPGGNHLMLIGLKEPLKEGGQIPLTLEFENASPVELWVTVLEPSATGPGRHEHDHSGMHRHENAGSHGSP